MDWRDFYGLFRIFLAELAGGLLYPVPTQVLFKPTPSLFLGELNKIHPEQYFLPNKVTNSKSYLEKYFKNRIK